MIRLNELQNNAKKKNNVFGVSQNINKEAALILEETLNEQ